MAFNNGNSVHHAPTEETGLLSAQQPVGNSIHDEEDEQETWNSPRINTYRFCSANFTLMIMGMNDACLGVSLTESPTPCFAC